VSSCSKLPLYSMTSSARASSCEGTSMPRTFAVLRLIISRASSAARPVGQLAWTATHDHLSNPNNRRPNSVRLAGDHRSTRS
jgi:hypothetical protein